MAKNNKKSQIPSVLAFEKKLVPSDGYMYETKWDDRSILFPLKLKEKSVRGTISNRLKKSNEAEKLNKKIENPNLQTVDSCNLGAEQDTLKLNYTLKVLGNIGEPSVCNKSEFKRECINQVKKYIEKYSCSELAYRYAHNIACARFLWRNRVGGHKIETHVETINLPNKKKWKFSKISINDFDQKNDQIKELAEEIKKVLSSSEEFLLLKIDAYVFLGNKQEVYPSEELVLDQNKNQKGSKSKVLYSVNEIAAMHSQKIGNALRTIDTWYPEYNQNNGGGSIAIEPYGAVTNLGKAYRNPKDKCDFYSLFDNWVLNKKELSEKEQHYVIAVLIRGGVFGESAKENTGQ